MISTTTRSATNTDLQTINDIFNYYVEHSTCVWTTCPCSEDERRTWFVERDGDMPVVVAEYDGRVVGWGALSTFRAAYTAAGTLEDSVYVHHDFHRRGIGRQLLQGLIHVARQNGTHSILANISADQEASILLHKSVGFEQVAHLRQVGRKFGRWMDAVYLQLVLGGGDVVGE